MSHEPQFSKMINRPNTIPVAVGQSLEDLLEALGCANLGVESTCHDVFKEFATGQEFENEEMEAGLLKLL